MIGLGILLFFIDGIGLAPAGEANPLSYDTAFLRGIVPRPGLTADLFPPEVLRGGGVPALALEWPGGAGGRGVPVRVAALDACLGVPGLPQSATGQTVLFTGQNAPQRLGRHLSGFPTPTLLEMLAEHSLFKKAAGAGRRATFANPFPAGYFEAVASRRRRHATTTAAVLAGGCRLRRFRDLERGRAVSHDLTGASLRARGFRLPQVEPEAAGRHLASLVRDYDLVLFEYFLTDRAGHAQDAALARDCLDNLGRAIGSLLAGLDLAEHTVFLVSDHGNLEDLSVATHTRNPVPAVAIGAQAPVLEGATSLLDVAPAVLRALGIPA